jgi:membrane-associated phospholipid phosphatase
MKMCFIQAPENQYTFKADDFMKICFIPVLILLLTTGVSAQVPDSSTIIFTEAADTFPKKETTISNRRFIKSLIIPTAMIGYGVITLNNHSLREVNNTFRREVLRGNPSFRTNIDDFMQVSPAVAVYALNLAGIKGKHNLFDRTLILTISVAMEQSVAMILKNNTYQVRPDGTNFRSFPSGHTANGFATAEFLYQEYKDVSPLYGIAGYAVAAATGALRMFNNRHWFSDVVAGAGIGIISTKIVYRVYPWISSKLLHRTKRSAIITLPSFSKDYLGVHMIYPL